MADKSMLVISPIPTHPSDAGNRSRLYSLLKRFKGMGFDIHFLYLDKGHGAVYDSMSVEWKNFYRVVYGRGALRKLSSALRILMGKTTPFLPGAIDAWISRAGVGRCEPLPIDAWYDTSIDKFIRKLQDQISFDVVLVEYVYLSKALELFDDGTIKIIDTHDVFSNRHVQFLEKGKNPVFFYTSPEEEAKGLGRADIVLAIQENDSCYLKELCDRDVITIGHLPNIDIGPAIKNYHSAPNRLLYVATNTVPNQDAMEFFLAEIWPDLVKAYPSVRVDVIGGICFYLKGKVDSSFNLLYKVDDLFSYYQGEYIVINPVRIGTGLKIKNMEALFSGKPLVTTSIGAQGLEKWAGKAFLVADDPREFADCIGKLLSDAAACKNLHENALEFARQYRDEHERSIQALISRLSPSSV